MDLSVAESKDGPLSGGVQGKKIHVRELHTKVSNTRGYCMDVVWHSTAGQVHLAGRMRDNVEERTLHPHPE